MDYIAVLDYQHLDNGLFLSAFAKSVAAHENSRGLILHGDSEYTERLIQTGMIREEATRRAIKDLNHRLIALLADYGISTIGLNGYQRSLVLKKNKAITIDTDQLKNLPSKPHLLLSNLVDNPVTGTPERVELDQLAEAFQRSLKTSHLFVFTLDDTEELINHNRPDEISAEKMDENHLMGSIPNEFRNNRHSFYLTTAQEFANYPDLGKAKLIRR